MVRAGRTEGAVTLPIQLARRDVARAESHTREVEELGEIQAGWSYATTWRVPVQNQSASALQDVRAWMGRHMTSEADAGGW